MTAIFSVPNIVLLLPDVNKNDRVNSCRDCQYNMVCSFLAAEGRAKNDFFSRVTLARLWMIRSFVCVSDITLLFWVPAQQHENTAAVPIFFSDSFFLLLFQRVTPFVLRVSLGRIDWSTIFARFARARERIENCWNSWRPSTRGHTVCES